ncbi:hypothetical protein [uncultured Dysgonomonas sp.]|uniref:DUF4906 domain-containing protein n=1 Tax=uncultured Dysgonomonas sp. TaxID=206096 RepID=A0A212JBB5_9BACT|nr:hypothetical protein [uncultured Dysgonomonas sp.]SBV96525.1 exported hypothetical protein [uncultured Dysgonomonas sp.]
MVTINRIILFSLTILMFASCRNDEFENEPVKAGDAKVRVSFYIRNPERIETKTAPSQPGSDDENEVDNFHVFLFENNESGKLAAHGGNDGKDFVEMNPSSGTYKICIITNFSYNWNLISQYSDLKQIVLGKDYLPVSGDEEGELTENSPKVVMYKEDIIKLEASEIAQPIELGVERIVAKLKFEIYNSLPEGQTYEIKKVSVCNTFDKSALLPTERNKATEPQEEIIIFQEVNGIQPSEGQRLIPKIQYIYDNLAGEVSKGGSDQKNKGEKTFQLERKPAYLSIEGTYSYPNGDRKAVKQKVYLGSDNHSDFNVGRNEFHKYTIKITKEDENDTRVESRLLSDLSFTSATEKQDAHFVIYPIKIKARNVSNWTVSVPDDCDWLWLKTDLSEHQQLGYWIESEAGTKSISSSETGEDITIYACLYENAQQAQERDIWLTLQETGNDEEKVQFQVKQLPVNWNGSIGNERLEEYGADSPNGYQWGFDWNRKITYYTWGLFNPTFYAFVGWLYEDEYDAVKTVYWVVYTDITIDYSKITGTKGAESQSDGLANTWNLYNNSGGTVSDLEAYLRSRLKSKDESGTWNSVKDYAARICLLKNKFYLKGAYDPESGETYFVPTIDQKDIKWYLPAIGEIDDINDSDYPMADDSYWSSTAVVNKNHSYFYRQGRTHEDSREKVYKVRAVRQR